MVDKNVFIPSCAKLKPRHAKYQLQLTFWFDFMAFLLGVLFWLPLMVNYFGKGTCLNYNINLENACRFQWLTQHKLMLDQIIVRSFFLGMFHYLYRLHNIFN
ncbi:hypothetical protein ACJX0J_040937, partial [Zea mays]